MHKSVADILHESRQYLEEHGWVRGRLEDGGRVCAVGAIRYSQGWDSNNLEQEDLDKLFEVIDRLEVVLDRPHSYLAEWNDMAAKNKQEVLDLFAKTEKIELAGFDPDAA